MVGRSRAQGQVALGKARVRHLLWIRPVLHSVQAIGPVEVTQPRVLDRRIAGRDGHGEDVDAAGQPVVRFSSKILPPYLRKTKALEELIPWLYLKGVSTGGFAEALQALVGPQAAGLSVTTITRLMTGWQEEHQTWSRRSLKDRQYVYLWADGIHTCICGPMASTSAFGWRKIANASWC